MYLDGKIVIVGAKRTPIGKFGGSLSTLQAHQLGAELIKQLLISTKLASNEVTEVVLGQVLTAGCGQNPARIASILAGIGVHTPAYCVNQVCGSGLKSIILAAYKILIDKKQIIIAGGQENMSYSPHLAYLRNGIKMGEVKMIDSMLVDGLTDAFNHYSMGITAENLVEKYGITRKEQDEFAYLSQKKAEAASKDGSFKNEIIPITIKDKIIEVDEQPRIGLKIEDLEKLKPVFKPTGSVTAGNSSTINDGAAAVIMMHESEAKQRHCEILARVISCAEAGVDPALMGIGPVDAIRKALESANWNINELDIIELNEAFAVQSIAVKKELNLDLNKVNVNGGAIALGHPIGASGARCLVTLIHQMKSKKLKKGLVSLCIGGGMGIAMCVES